MACSQAIPRRPPQALRRESGSINGWPSSHSSSYLNISTHSATSDGGILLRMAESFDVDVKPSRLTQRCGRIRQLRNLLGPDARRPRGQPPRPRRTADTPWSRRVPLYRRTRAPAPAGIRRGGEVSAVITPRLGARLHPGAAQHFPEGGESRESRCAISDRFGAEPLRSRLKNVGSRGRVVDPEFSRREPT